MSPPPGAEGGSGRPCQQSGVGRNLELEAQTAVELRIGAAVAQVLLEHVVEREAADERVALPAAVGDVAAGNARAVAVAQRPDAARREHPRVGRARKGLRDVGEGDEPASRRHLDEDPDDAPTLYVSGDNASVDVVGTIAERCGPIDLAVLFCGGVSLPHRFDGAYLTLSAEAAAQAAEVLGARAVVPVHFQGWAHFTQGAHELRSAFAAAGMTDRLVLAEPGASVSL